MVNNLDLMALAIVVDWLKTVGICGAISLALSLVISLRGGR